MTPGYPKYYIGDSVCQWTLYAGQHQRIKLTVLDLALRRKYSDTLVSGLKALHTKCCVVLPVRKMMMSAGTIFT